MFRHQGMGRNYKDLTGKTYHKLTAIKHLGVKQRNDGRGNSIWLFRCECGNQVEALGRYVERGYKKSCGCHVRRGAQAAAWHVYNKYRDGDLQFDDFYRLSQQPCHYCGSEASNCAKKVFKYNGLDRLDNSRGHDLDNLVPCCWTCNEKKSDMNYDEFISWISKIYCRLQSSARPLTGPSPASRQSSYI